MSVNREGRDPATNAGGTGGSTIALRAASRVSLSEPTPEPGTPGLMTPERRFRVILRRELDAEDQAPSTKPALNSRGNPSRIHPTRKCCSSMPPMKTTASSTPTSAPGSRPETTTPIHSSGPRAPTRSSNRSPATAHESMNHDTSRLSSSSRPTPRKCAKPFLIGGTVTGHGGGVRGRPGSIEGLRSAGQGGFRGRRWSSRRA